MILTLLTKPMLDHYTAAGHWRTETIYALAATHAGTTPNAPAIRDAHKTLTYRTLVQAADALANDLAAKGLHPGDRIAVWLPSRAETAIALLACSRNAYTCCPSLHRDHTVAEVTALCHRMRAAALVAQPHYGADAPKHDIFTAEIPTLRHTYRLQPGQDFEPHSAPETPPNTDPNRIIYLPFTSGTTAQPKGVMHSDNTLLANARAIAQDWDFTPQTVTYTLSPLSHNLGLGALITSIVAGGQLVVHDLPRASSLLDRLIETRATFLFGVPTHAIDLLTELRTRNARTLGHVKGFRISGAAATPEIIRALMEHGVTPQSGYGMTETCSHQYTLPTDAPEDIAETSGRPCANTHVKIVREDNPDQDAPPHHQGQIAIKGASLMLGYFDDQHTTEQSFNAEGWFLTGDLGTTDPRGYLRITGRKKDLIIRGGHNIYPARIEALAMRHPAIDKVAAFPVPDPRLGEKLCLAIVPRQGQAIDANTLLTHLDQAGLSRTDMPEYLLHLDALPMTASGKITKRDLAQRVREGHLHPTPIRFEPANA